MKEEIIFSPMSISRGLLGVLTILFIAYAISFNRKRIDWKLVGSGLLLEIVLMLSIFYIPIISTTIEICGGFFVKILNFTEEGVKFLLGPYAMKEKGFSFLFHSLPNIIFFSSLVSMLYHWGIIQRIVSGFSWALRRIMPINGVEGLVVSGNIFLGMTESPILIKNYLSKMNNSELFIVLVSGMGTIAGTLMGTYISMLGNDNAVDNVLFAKHIISASLLAAPGSIILSKMIYPQTEESICMNVHSAISETKNQNTLLDAISDGMSMGLKLMANIAGMLLVFIALIALVNYFTEGIIGEYTGLNEWIINFTNGKSTGLTIEFILGLIFSPLMWLIGIPTEDILLTGSLLGQKTILNEFVAYFQLAEWKGQELFTHSKSIIMSTYLLCGFANVSSIGILLGGFSILAPEKRSFIAKHGVKALIAGTLVSVLSATIVGMFF